MGDHCKECEGGGCACAGEGTGGFTLSAEEIGVEVSVRLDHNYYTSDEESEIASMVARVINSWVRRRETMLLNPGVYGITVN